MKEKVFDVLMYLFENYMDDAQEIGPDQDALIVELSQAGFPRGEINKAFLWLEELSTLREAMPTGMISAARSDTTRYFIAEEIEKIGQEGLGFLLQLERRGVLDTLSREIIIDRIMALDTYDIELEHLKWIVLMVLYNQSGQDQAYNLLEDLVLSDQEDCLH